MFQLINGEDGGGKEEAHLQLYENLFACEMWKVTNNVQGNYMKDVYHFDFEGKATQQSSYQFWYLSSGRVKEDSELTGQMEDTRGL